MYRNPNSLLYHSNISISLFWFFNFKAAALFFASIRRWRAASEFFLDATMYPLFFELLINGFWFSVLGLIGFRIIIQLFDFISSSLIKSRLMSSICKQTMSQNPAKSPSSVRNSPSPSSTSSDLSLRFFTQRPLNCLNFWLMSSWALPMAVWISPRESSLVT